MNEGMMLEVEQQKKLIDLCEKTLFTSHNISVPSPLLYQTFLLKLAIIFQLTLSMLCVDQRCSPGERGAVGRGHCWGHGTATNGRRVKGCAQLPEGSW